MGGTTDGGKKTRDKLLAEDPDFYKKIRAKVKNPVAGKTATGSFTKGSERARIAGAKGGKKSKRRPAQTIQATERTRKI